MKMMKNAIVAQSGGPTTAINASLAGVIKGCLESHEIDVLYGALNGVEGLMDERLVNLTDIFDHNKENLNVLKLTPAMYLGSCRRKLKDVDQDSSEYDIIINIFRKYHIHYFFYIGGNDSMDTVGKMSRYVKEHQMDVKVIGIPKTIDNDIWGTDMTFGFQSALEIATNAIDCIHTTAASHGRVFIVEIMGHKVGSLTLNAGVAGGADVILIPEIPYDINKVVEAIQKRNKAGKRFTILAVAEGAISKEDAELPKKKYKEKLAERAKKYPSVSYEIADQIQQVTGSEVRITVPGHMQRGGEPCAYDRVLSTRIGAGAAQAIMDEEYGVMIGVINGKIKRVPLAECAGKLKMVSPKDQLVKAAKQIGISFGD